MWKLVGEMLTDRHFWNGMGATAVITALFIGVIFVVVVLAKSIAAIIGSL